MARKMFCSKAETALLRENEMHWGAMVSEDNIDCAVVAGNISRKEIDF